MATGSADKTVKIWGLDFGDCHRSLFAHDDVYVLGKGEGCRRVSCVMFTAPTEEDDNLLWSGGKDGKLKQWDAIKFEKVQTLDEHSAEIRALVGTSSGNFIVSRRSEREGNRCRRRMTSQYGCGS